MSALPFLAFGQDDESSAAFRQFIAKKGFSEACLRQGGVEEAAAYLGAHHPSPLVLCVEIESNASASAALDKLADVCDPGTKVIIYGAINEYSFFRWLLDMGITDYLLKPLKIEALEAAYAKATHIPSPAAPPAPEKKEGTVISVIGTRGGAGATMVSVNLAWILSHLLKQKTALLDFDPQLGTVALALDLEPGRGLRDALDKPERIDGLFLDRVMARYDDMLSILSTEEPLEDQITPGEKAAEALLKQIRLKFATILIDLPRHLSPFTRYALKASDHILCVTELSVAGLREALRYLDYCRDVLKASTPIFIGNRHGAMGKYNMPPQEFEKGLGAKLACVLPHAAEACKASMNGQVLAEAARGSAVARHLQTLAARFLPEGANAQSRPGQGRSLFGRIKKG
jgi:pilus assembly protein CpaE